MAVQQWQYSSGSTAVAVQQWQYSMQKTTADVRLAIQQTRLHMQQDNFGSLLG
jgi:hypothetical protein